jgi:hypothetical protein
MAAMTTTMTTTMTTSDDTIENSSFKIQIIGSGGDIYKNITKNVKDPESTKTGFGLVEAPTAKEYSIKISSDAAEWFEIKSIFIGDDKVKINNNRRIFYPGTEGTIVSTMETGTDKSLMFISPSLQEKSAGNIESGHKISDKIKITLQPYKKEERYIESSTSRGGGTSRGGDTFRGSGTFRGGDTFRGGGTSRGGGYESNGLSGGATVSGGTFHSDIETIKTKDKFTAVGEDVNFTIQLVNTQTDAVKFKSNKIYYQRILFNNKIKIIDINRRLLEYQKLLEKKSALEEENSKYAFYEDHSPSLKDQTTEFVEVM